MCSKIAVVLSGCGVYDGSEVHEAAAALAAVSRAGYEAACFAPNRLQTCEIDHLTGETLGETTKNCLVEAARISRAKLSDLEELTEDLIEEMSALLIPGGFGAAKTLSNFALGGDLELDPEVERVVKVFNEAEKPIGLSSIASILVAKVLGEKGVKITFGKKGEGWPYSGEGDAMDTAAQLGCQVEECTVDEVCEDTDNKIVTTPAYLYDGKVHQVHDGVTKMVEHVIGLI
eukprot:GFUD01001539.1.p1 GENE.GFUD01001539.1~~GFUD01001539.1.p1  ORF type:complete len:231 (+),score=68.53 GFUD01001539.1:245-937(+)